MPRILCAGEELPEAGTDPKVGTEGTCGWGCREMRKSHKRLLVVRCNSIFRPTREGVAHLPGPHKGPEKGREQRKG